MENLEQQILNKIKTEKITLRPKYFFTIKNTILWLLYILAIFVSSLAFGIFLELLQDHDWSIYPRLGLNFYQYLLASVPYFWLIFILAAIFLAIYNFKKTNYSYRHRDYIIAAATATCSVALGAIFFFSGIGELIDTELYETTNFYSFVVCHHNDFWQNPEKGLITGAITDVQDENNFTLTDPQGKQWQVSNSDDLIWPEAEESLMVKISGEKDGADSFIAQDIQPLIPKESPRKKIIRHFVGH